MTDLGVAVRALGGDVSCGQVMCPGPGHSDTDRSLSVRFDQGAPDGFVVHSFAGDDPIQCRDHVRERLGLDPFKPNGSRQKTPGIFKRTDTAKVVPLGTVVATYAYSNSHGAPLYEVRRFEPKAFRPYLPGAQSPGIGDVERVLYRLPELLKYPDATVFVCEGEKDADRISALGHCATTIAGGANARWDEITVDALAGRDCILLEDNDDAGRDYTRNAANRLRGVAKTIRVVRLPGLPPKGDVSDWLDADLARDADKLAETCFAVAEWQPDKSEPEDCNKDSFIGPEPLPFVLPRDITLVPKAYLIDGFVGAAEISAWYGPPDGGKSTVVLDAGCHVAAGLDYCGREVTQGGVLYIAVERGAVVKRRVLAWCKRHDRPDIPLAVVAEMIDLRTGDIDGDRIIATAKAFARQCDLPVVWIIIDTLNRALAGGDENSSKDMGALLLAVDRIHRATGAHCSLIHHVPVDRTDRMRGHSSVLGAVDLTVRIIKDDKIVTVEADKANDLIEKPRFAFRFESEELTREGLKVVTAPVLNPFDGVTAHHSGPRLSAKNRAALRVLQECVAECGKKATTNRAPEGALSVTIDLWKRYLASHGLINLESSHREQFRRIHVTLKNAGVIGTWEQEVWCVT